MGMQNISEELEDLAFAALDPEARESIVRRMEQLDAQSHARIARISDEIKRKIAESGIEAWVQGRAKRPYSIWRKLKDKKINFEQLSDVFGFRAVVGSVEDCYRALGVLHQTWRMVPERFKDFISLPKSNGYRSVHTTVMGPQHQRVEGQIRTQEMHEVPEAGGSGEKPPPRLGERFVVRGRARAEIRRYLRHAQRDQHVALGRKILAKIFSDQGFELTDKAVEGVLRKLRLAKAEDVYADIGRGALRADEVLQAVYPELKPDPKRKRSSYFQPNSASVSIAGLTEGIGYRLGGCCHPIPGDRIIGLMVPGSGCVIHLADFQVLDRPSRSIAHWTK